MAVNRNKWRGYLTAPERRAMVRRLRRKWRALTYGRRASVYEFMVLAAPGSRSIRFALDWIEQHFADGLAPDRPECH